MATQEEERDPTKAMSKREKTPSEVARILLTFVPLHYAKHWARLHQLLGEIEATRQWIVEQEREAERINGEMVTRREQIGVRLARAAKARDLIEQRRGPPGDAAVAAQRIAEEQLLAEVEQDAATLRGEVARFEQVAARVNGGIRGFKQRLAEQEGRVRAREGLLAGLVAVSTCLSASWVATCAGGLWLATKAWAPGLWNLLQASGAKGVATGVFVLAMLAGGLYALRETHRRVYSLTELAAAAAGALSALTNQEPDLSRTVALQAIAAVYLAVRAMDNYAQGHAEAREAIAAAIEDARATAEEAAKDTSNALPAR